MRNVALALVLTLSLAGCGTSALSGVAPMGQMGASAQAASPEAVLERFEALVKKYVPAYDAKNADHREALLHAAGYDATGKPGYEAVTAPKIAMIDKYLKAVQARKFGRDILDLGLIEQIKDHTDYVFPNGNAKGIYPDASAAHLRMFKKFMALVERYEVRQADVAVSRFLGIAYGSPNGGAEEGVDIFEDYLAALDKAGFAVRAQNFSLMNFSGRGGFPSLLQTICFEEKKGITRSVGPAFAKKALPDVLTALKGQERTATADDVEEALQKLYFAQK